MEHRKATPQDISEILEITTEAQKYMDSQGFRQWVVGYPSKETFLSDIQKGNCYVFCDEKILAVMIVTFDMEQAYEIMKEGSWKGAYPYGVIHRSAISKDARGSGLANELFAFAKELCGENSVKVLRCDTHQENKPMIKVMERNGLEYCGVIYYDDGSNTFQERRVAYEVLL